MLNEPVIDVVDQQNTSIPHKLSSAIQSKSDADKLVSEDSSKKAPCSVTHSSLPQAEILSSSPTDATKDVSTESYESESKINLSSHSSNESLTYIPVSDDNDNNNAPEEIEHSLSTENSTITSEPLNPLDAVCDNPVNAVNPLDMDNPPVTDSPIDISFPALTSSASFFNPPKTSAPVNGLTKTVDMIQEDGDTSECMSDDNPFKPVDKVPVQHDDAILSDSQHVQLVSMMIIFRYQFQSTPFSYLSSSFSYYYIVLSFFQYLFFIIFILCFVTELHVVTYRAYTCSYEVTIS